jgi:GLPGLI family protein
MKNLLQRTLILLLFSNISISQNQKKLFVEYDVTYGALSYKANLVAANGKAVYFHDIIDPKDVKKGITNDGNGNFNISISDGTPLITKQKYYSKQDSAEVYFTGSYKNKLCLIEDKVPDVLWKIQPESQKQIQNFTCTKAIGQFRGSEIVVYFTTDLPMPFGPWKFKGLPGVILEAYVANDKQNYNFTVSKVIYPYNNDVSLELSEKEKSLKRISFQEHEESYVNNILKKLAIINARTTQSNTKITAGTKKMTRHGVEKVFEWE